MLTKSLNNIVNYLSSINNLKGFIHSEQTEFRGLTDKYVSYFLIRSLSKSDKDFTLTERTGECEVYNVSYDAKIIIQSKCYNDCLIPTLLTQLESRFFFQLQSFSSNTERIYKEETGQDLQIGKDFQLYAIYLKVNDIIDMSKKKMCALNKIINLIDCGC